MSSLKQVISNAILTVSSDPAYAGREFETPEVAREEFTKALLEVLFPEEEKKAAPKPKKAEKKEEKKAEKAEEEKKERKPRAPMTEEAKAAMVAKRAATLAAKQATPPKAEPATPPKAPKAPKKEKAPAAEVNLDNTPSNKKKVNAAIKELKATADAKDVFAYLNGLSNAAFHDKPLRDHVRSYIATLAKPEAVEQETQQAEVDLLVQDFEGETYYINPETKRVYTMDETGTHPVGYVGMAKFADMVIEDDA
jgi:hypothetical protein